MENTQQKTITQRSAKQEIWMAYENILKEIAQSGSAKDENVKTSFEDVEKKRIIDKVSSFKVDKVVSDINTLKISLNDALNGLSDKLVEELKNLEKVKQATKVEEDRLENVYKMKTEADSLLSLIEARELKKAEFEKKAREDQENLKSDADKKQKQNERENEEYEHNLKMARKKEEYEYELKQLNKERDFAEKMTAREKELKLREENMTVRENEFKALRAKMESFPLELEKAVKESAKKAKEESENQAKIQKEMAEKDFAGERELAKFKIASLEDIVKKQIAHIQSLDSQLAAANQKTQQLAVKIIETGGRQYPNQTDATVNNQKTA